jgi:rhodanese-related sulfurtransferase
MNLRRHLIETATLVVVSVAVAFVSNALASKERKLKLPGDYPNATVVPRPAPAGDPPAPVPAAAGEASPSMKPPARPAVAASPVPQPSPAAPPANAAPAADLLARFPPHPDVPWVEIGGDDAAFLQSRGVLFLDARRTKDYEQGHVRGARPFAVWESDIDDKVLSLLGEGRDANRPVVLYCSGGDCEDSHLLGQKLFGAGFNNLLVYKDGFPDWVKRGGAVGRGDRP